MCPAVAMMKYGPTPPYDDESRIEGRDLRSIPTPLCTIHNDDVVLLNLALMVIAIVEIATLCITILGI
jgi:hypothetical protein